MSNRVSVELGLNVAGYKQGMKDAKDATQQYNTETKKIKDSLGNMRQELGKAKKEVQNLALAYTKLDAEQRKSQFGIEMKRQLDMAKESAAQLIDLQGDIQAELKNMASDTRLLDTLSESMGIFGDATAAAMGIVAQFTGNEEDAKKAVVAFTTAQSILGTVTKLQNALQMQSNTMLAVTKVQTLAAAAAARIKTAAEGKGIIATKAATVAQAAFNTVAMANPYVLLATAIIALVAAIGTYVYMSNKATEAEKQNNKEKQKAIELAKQRQKAEQDMADKVASAGAEQLGTYYKLQLKWRECNGDVQKQKKFMSDYKDEIKKTGFEVKGLSDAESFFVKNTNAVVQAIMERAKAQAAYEIMVERIKNSLQKLEEKSVRSGHYSTKATNDNVTKEEREYVSQKLGNDGFNTALGVRYDVNQKGLDLIQKKRSEEAKKRRKQFKADAEKEMEESVKDYAEIVKNSNAKLQKIQSKYGLTSIKEETKTKSGKGDSEKVKAVSGSLEDLQNQLNDKQDKLKKGLIPPKAIEKTKKDIDDLKKRIEKEEIRLGIKDGIIEGSLEDMEKDLSDMQEQLRKGLIPPEAEQETIATIEALKKKIEKEEIRLGFKVDPDEEKAKKEIEKIQEKLKSLNKEKGGIELTPKMSSFEQATFDPSESTQPTLEGVQEQMDFNDNLIKQLKKLQEEYAALGEAGKSGYEEITEQLEATVEKQTELSEQAENLSKADKRAKKLSKTIGKVGDVTAAAGDMFSALGEASEDEGLKVVGIVAQAVATVALSFAQALTSCKTWVEWLAFGLSGAATMISLISQIKSVTSGYATGGIVGGSSYSGDNIYARLNSGEMILNKSQQQNLFDAINSGNLGSGGGTQQVQVQGVIRGTDLLLVQKNANKVASKTGTQINF